MEKEMGDTEKDADKLDEQIWGSDNEEQNNSEDENEMSDDETGKGNKDESNAHNDLDAKKKRFV